MRSPEREAWWEEPEGRAHDPLVRLVDDIRERDRTRLRDARVHQDIYEGRYLFSDANGEAVRLLDRHGLGGSQLNFTASAVDFVHMKVTAQPPSVRCATRGGDWSRRIRANKLTRFIEAQSDALRLPEQAALALHMALRTGTGVLKVSAVDGDVSMDVVPVEELHVDPTEATYGRPRHIYQTRATPRGELLDRFGDDESAVAAIEAAGNARDVFDRRLRDDADVVDVYEGWQLPDEDGADGRHVVCVQGATLLDEPWGHPRFPFAVVHDRPPAPGRGFWGQGLVERLHPVQFEIDELVGQVSEALRVGARLKVFIERGSRVNLDHLAEPEIGAVIEYDDQVPTFVTPEPVSRELLEHLRYMVEQLFSQAGMSQDAASSMKPAGLGSGVALLTYHDFQTQRHVDLAKRFKQLVVDACALMLDRAQDLAEEGGDWTATPRGRLGPIAWSEVEMDRDQFVLELEAVSPVPESYAGRLQMIERMAQTGRLPEPFVAALLEDPDTVRMNRMLTADAGFVEWAIDLLIDPDQPMPPVMDEQNLAMTVDMVRAALMDAVPEGAPPEVVDRLQRYMQECVDRMPAPPVAQAPGPVDPTAMAPVAATLG